MEHREVSKVVIGFQRVRDIRFATIIGSVGSEGSELLSGTPVVIVVVVVVVKADNVHTSNY
jgi:hypothetical protein